MNNPAQAIPGVNIAVTEEADKTRAGVDNFGYRNYNASAPTKRTFLVIGFHAGGMQISGPSQDKTRAVYYKAVMYKEGVVIVSWELSAEPPKTPKKFIKSIIFKPKFGKSEREVF